MCVVLALMPGAVAWEKRLVKVEDGSDAAKSVFSSPDNVSPAPSGKSATSGTSVEVISNNERSWRELSLPRPKNGISGRSRCRTEAVTCGIRYEPTSWMRYQSSCMWDTPPTAQNPSTDTRPSTLVVRRLCGDSEMCHSLFSARPNATPPSGTILPIVGCRP